MTGQQLIESSLRLIGQLSPGYTASQPDLDAGLVALNLLISSWSARPETTLQALALDSVNVNGIFSFTWGTGGVLATTRPSLLRSAYAVIPGGPLFPMKIVGVDEFDRIEDRTATSKFAKIIFPEYSSSTFITCHIWPTPNDAGSFVSLRSFKPLVQIASLATAIALPDGYEHALRYNLAMTLALEHRRTLDPSIPAMAKEGMDAIIALNQRIHAQRNGGGA